jgi:hypothetical protein
MPRRRNDMKRIWFALALSAATSVSPAQEAITLHWSFSEVVAGTTAPVSNPNGVIEPGESARISMTVSFAPPVGTIMTYTPPPGPGFGPVAGLANAFGDLRTTVEGRGTWYSLQRDPAWAIGGIGSVYGDGRGIAAWQLGQFPLPGATANPANPVTDVWRVHWTPDDYSARTVTFTGQKAVSSPGTGGAVYINYGEDPSAPQYLSKPLHVNFGSLQIQVVPSPSALGVLALAAAAAGRRRRGG